MPQKWYYKRSSLWLNRKTRRWVKTEKWGGGVSHLMRTWECVDMMMMMSRWMVGSYESAPNLIIVSTATFLFVKLSFFFMTWTWSISDGKNKKRILEMESLIVKQHCSSTHQKFLHYHLHSSRSTKMCSMVRDLVTIS